VRIQKLEYSVQKGASIQYNNEKPGCVHSQEVSVYLCVFYDLCDLGSRWDDLAEHSQNFNPFDFFVNAIVIC
jgi:hypothetical protein